MSFVKPKWTLAQCLVDSSASITYKNFCVFNLEVEVSRQVAEALKEEKRQQANKLQEIMNRMEEMQKSMDKITREKLQQDQAMQTVIGRMENMERSMEQMKIENRRAINIGSELEQEIET